MRQLYVGLFVALISVNKWMRTTVFSYWCVKLTDVNFTAGAECCGCGIMNVSALCDATHLRHNCSIIYSHILYSYPLMNCMIAMCWWEYVSRGLKGFYVLISCLRIPPSPYMHHQTQLAETQFAYQLMRCKPIFIEQPGLKYPCWQFLCSLTLSFFPLFSIYFPLTFLPSRCSLPFLSSSALSMCLHASLQLEPRPSEILYRWTWSSQQSSGRRSTKRKRRRTGHWRRLFKDWRLSWTAGGTVILAPISRWQLTKTWNI